MRLSITACLLAFCISSVCVGDDAPIPGGILQPDPKLHWRYPDTSRHRRIESRLPIGGLTEFSVQVVDLFTLAGEVRIANLDVIATQLETSCPRVGVCDKGFTRDISEAVNLPISLNPPTSDGFITGTMTLPYEGYWKFRAATDFEGRQLVSRAAYYVPEPSSFLVAMLGLASLPMFRRRGLRRPASSPC